MNALKLLYTPMCLAMACLLFPVMAIITVYLWSASAGHVPWCVPFVEGCTTISRAARPEPMNLLFRWTMLPWVGLVALYWWLSHHWLRQQVPRRRYSRYAMVGFALLGTGGVALYALHLGGDTPMAEFMRSYGGVMVFSSLAFGQLMLVIAIRGHAPVPLGLRRGMLAVCLLLLGMGTMTAVGNAMLADGYALVSAMEWNFGLVMLFFFPLTGLAWRYTGFGR